MKQSNKKQKLEKVIRDDVIELPTGSVKIGIDAVPYKKSNVPYKKVLEELRKAAKEGIFPPITSVNE